MGRYLASLLIAAAGVGRTPADIRVLLYRPFRRRPAQPPDDLVCAGMDVRRMSHLVSNGVSAMVRAGAPTSIEGLLGDPDVLLYTRYWHGRRGRASTISMIYDLVFEVDPGSVDPGYLPRLRRSAGAAIERSDLVGVISNRMAVELNERHPSTIGRTLVLEPGPTPLPLAGARASRSLVRALGLEPDRFLLCVGTLEPRKNLLPLIEAVERMAPGLPLVLAGSVGWSSGPVTAAIQRAGPRVRHLDFVDDATLAALYQTAAALVFPSRYEGFGLPLLEALACGVPVACSDIPVFREIGGDAVRYFDHRDPDDIAGVVASLLADGDQRAIAATAGRARAAAYSWERSGQRLVGAATALQRGEPAEAWP